MNRQQHGEFDERLIASMIEMIGDAITLEELRECREDYLTRPRGIHGHSTEDEWNHCIEAYDRLIEERTGER